MTFREKESFHSALNVKAAGRLGLRDRRQAPFPASATPVECALPPFTSQSTSSWHAAGSTAKIIKSQAGTMHHHSRYNPSRNSWKTQNVESKDCFYRHHNDRRLSISSMLMDSGLFTLQQPSEGLTTPTNLVAQDLETSFQENHQDERSQSTTSTTQRFLSWHSKSMIKKAIPSKVKKLMGVGSNSSSKDHRAGSTAKNRLKSPLSASWHGMMCKQTNFVERKTHITATTDSFEERRPKETLAGVPELAEDDDCSSLSSRKPRFWFSKLLSSRKIKKKTSKSRGYYDGPPCEEITTDSTQQTSSPLITHKSWHGVHQRENEVPSLTGSSRRSSLPIISPLNDILAHQPPFRPEVSDVLLYNDEENVSSGWKFQVSSASSSDESEKKQTKNINKTSCLKGATSIVSTKSSLKRASSSSNDVLHSTSNGRKGQDSYETSSRGHNKLLIRGVSWHGHPSNSQNDDIRRLLEQKELPEASYNEKPCESTTNQTWISTHKKDRDLSSSCPTVDSGELENDKRRMSLNGSSLIDDPSSKWKLDIEETADPPRLPYSPAHEDKCNRNATSFIRGSSSLLSRKYLKKSSLGNKVFSQELYSQPSSPRSVDQFSEQMMDDGEMQAGCSSRIDVGHEYGASVSEEENDMDKWEGDVSIMQDPNISKLFVIMLHVMKRKFELVQVLSHLNNDTVADILLVASESCQTPLLQDQSYKSLYRLNVNVELKRSRIPMGSVPSGWKVSDGETLVAVPSGHTFQECLSLTHSVLRNPEIAALLNNVY